MTLAQIQALGTSASPRIIWATDTQAFYSIAAGSGGGSATNMSSLPKVYAALLSQSGTNAPVATVLQNTLGGTVVWSYEAAGTYRGNLTAAFTVNKTWVSVSRGNEDSGILTYFFDNTGGDFLELFSTGADLAPADGTLTKSSIEIRVYP